MTTHKTIWTFVITSVALFMVTLDNLVVTTALPVIREDLGASLSQLEWTVNGRRDPRSYFDLFRDSFRRRRCLARVEANLEICTEVHPGLLEVEPAHDVRCWLYHDASGRLIPEEQRSPVARRTTP